MELPGWLWLIGGLLYFGTAPNQYDANAMHDDLTEGV